MMTPEALQEIEDAAVVVERFTWRGSFLADCVRALKKMPRPQIAQEDPEVLDWCLGVTDPRNKAGDFVLNLALAALRADFENYPLLRPVLLQMLTKYPQYVALGRARG